MFDIANYFKANILRPFVKYVTSNSGKKAELKRTIRAKLLLLLVKTRVCIHFLEKCAIIRKDDFLNLPLKHPRRSAIESRIRLVSFGSKEDCSRGYKQIGRKVNRLFYAFMQTNGLELGADELLESIDDPDYQKSMVTHAQIEEIRSKIRDRRVKQIGQGRMILNFLRTELTPEAASLAKLHFYFPSPELWYSCLKLLSSNLIAFGIKMMSSSVSLVKEFFVPLNIFENELVPSARFPQTRVRVLRDSGFLDKVSKGFLVQRDFLDAKSLGQSMQKRFFRGFRKHLENYLPFDRKAEPSTLDSCLIQSKSEESENRHTKSTPRVSDESI